MGHLEAKAGREKTVKGCLSVSESGGPAFSFRPDAQDSVYIYIYICMPFRVHRRREDVCTCVMLLLPDLLLGSALFTHTALLVTGLTHKFKS